MTEIDAKALSWAELLKWFGQDDVRRQLPKPFTAWVQPHSTGYQATIRAEADGLPSIEVWRHSEWYSSIYDFNERGRIRGWQPDCDWAKPALEQFFSGLREKRIELFRSCQREQAEQADRDARLLEKARGIYAAAAASSMS